jgi:competence protein ComEA
MIRKLLTMLLASVALHAAAAVDLNQASQADLEQIAGIGPSLSARIVQARQGSSFKDWSDFVGRVRGVGPGSAMKMSQAGLTVGGRSYVAPAAEPAPAKQREKAPSR